VYSLTIVNADKPATGHKEHTNSTPTVAGAPETSHKATDNQHNECATQRRHHRANNRDETAVAKSSNTQVCKPNVNNRNVVRRPYRSAHTPATDMPTSTPSMDTVCATLPRCAPAAHKNDHYNMKIVLITAQTLTTHLLIHCHPRVVHGGRNCVPLFANTLIAHAIAIDECVRYGGCVMHIF
jgi:hypothetical protein